MDRLVPNGPNAQQIARWNGPHGEKWAKLADDQDIKLMSLGLATMEACDLQHGQSVLDIGCGSASTTFEIARRVGSEGRVTGIDISTPMLEVGRQRLKSLHLNNVILENQDAATCQFEPNSFDRAYSRFGIMFFVDPISAFANIKSGMTSGGRLGILCWQSIEKNPWAEIPLTVALKYVPAPPAADPEAPGQFSFAEPSRVQRILIGAGFQDIEMQPCEMALLFGENAALAAKSLLEAGPAGRLLADVSEEIRSDAIQEVCDRVVDYQADDGVRIPSSTWIITAFSP